MSDKKGRDVSSAGGQEQAKAASAGEQEQKRRGRQNREAPLCPYHPETRCVCKGSASFFTRYYCPQPGCTYSEKVPRPELLRQGHLEDFSAR